MIDITAHLVRALISTQFPAWSELPVRPVDRQGWDNRTFRLGEELTVRLPSAQGYAAAVTKEDRCLPGLARHVPLPVPEPVAVGAPGAGYPYAWSVRRWLPGDTVEVAPGVDRTRLARDLGDFLRDLRGAPPGRGPAAGRHSYYRGCHPSVYGDEVEQALDRLADAVDVAACRAVWAQALTSAWPSAPTARRTATWPSGTSSPGTAPSRPSSTSVPPASATPPVTSSWPGRTSPARNGRSSVRRPVSPTTPGTGPVAGRCGRPW
ncbi:conserved hypothetical protein [Streptomyces scabiei 87.22]|uniref:Aminoglycoside phosphotransferase domain-containing protein n=1 Tax=Streptomyces scabiei (strain 87.22) TaxID=680198 RepID=C9Z577_STRSW|nr:conserved hypothetical protein [Streptomyces scabiei 87.22]